MKKMVYGLWFMVYGLCLLSTINYTLSTPCFAQQNIQPSQEEKVQKARYHYAAGKELIQQGSYAAANDEFKKAQGLLQGASGQSQTQALAKDALKTIVPEANQPEGSGLPSDRQSHQPEGSGAASDKPEGDTDEALSFYLKAIELAPGNINLHYNLALLYLKTKQYKQAATRLEKVIQLNPGDKDAYYNLGVLYESYLGDKKKSLDYYARYIKYGSANGDALEVKQWMRQLKRELKK